MPGYAPTQPTADLLFQLFPPIIKIITKLIFTSQIHTLLTRVKGNYETTKFTPHQSPHHLLLRPATEKLSVKA